MKISRFGFKKQKKYAVEPSPNVETRDLER